jgi:hypothetical protein
MLVDDFYIHVTQQSTPTVKDNLLTQYENQEHERRLKSKS